MTLPEVLAGKLRLRDAKVETDWNLWEYKTVSIHRAVLVAKCSRSVDDIEAIGAAVQRQIKSLCKISWWRGFAFGVVMEVLSFPKDIADVERLIDVRAKSKGTWQWLILSCNSEGVALGVHTWIEGYLSSVYRDVLAYYEAGGQTVGSFIKEKDKLMSFLATVGKIHGQFEEFHHLEGYGVSGVAYPSLAWGGVGEAAVYGDGRASSGVRGSAASDRRGKEIDSGRRFARIAAVFFSILSLGIAMSPRMFAIAICLVGIGAAGSFAQQVDERSFEGEPVNDAPSWKKGPPKAFNPNPAENHRPYESNIFGDEQPRIERRTDLIAEPASQEIVVIETKHPQEKIVLSGLIEKLKQVAENKSLSEEDKEIIQQAATILTNINGKTVVDTSRPPQPMTRVVPYSSGPPASDANPTGGPYSISQGKDGAILLDRKTGKSWWLQSSGNAKQWVQIGGPDESIIPESSERRQVGEKY